MTRSPRFTVRTSGPASSTTPMNSWPITAPGCTSAPPRPWYWCRSDPQTALVVIRSTTSVDWTIFGSATVSTRTSPTPRNAIAFIARLLRSPVVSRRMPPAPLLVERQGRGPAHARALVAGHDRDPGRRERGREGVRAGRFEDAGFARGERGGHAPGDDHHLGIQAVHDGAEHRAQRLARLVDDRRGQRVARGGPLEHQPRRDRLGIAAGRAQERSVRVAGHAPARRLGDPAPARVDRQTPVPPA